MIPVMPEQVVPCQCGEHNIRAIDRLVTDRKTGKALTGRMPDCVAITIQNMLALANQPIQVKR